MNYGGLSLSYKEENSPFNQLVYSLYSSGMQSLGKIAGPNSNNIEVNPENAKISIEMLEMLKMKTKGNLDFSEKNSLERAVTQLKLNYVEVLNER